MSIFDNLISCTEVLSEPTVGPLYQLVPASDDWLTAGNTVLQYRHLRLACGQCYEDIAGLHLKTVMVRALYSES